MSFLCYSHHASGLHSFSLQMFMFSLQLFMFGLHSFSLQMSMFSVFTCSVSWSPCALAVTIWKGIPCSTFQRVGDIHGRGWQCKTTIVLLSTRLLRNYVCLPTCQVHWCSCARTSCHFPIALSLTLSVASVCLTSHNFPSQCVWDWLRPSQG